MNGLAESSHAWETENANKRNDYRNVGNHLQLGRKRQVELIPSRDGKEACWSR